MPFSRLIANTPETGTLNLAASLMSRRTQRPQRFLLQFIISAPDGGPSIVTELEIQLRDASAAIVVAAKIAIRRERSDYAWEWCAGARTGKTPMDEDDDEAIMAPTASGWRASNIIAWSNGRATIRCAPGAPRVSAMRPDFRVKQLERAKGFEPSTPTLARLCSTPSDTRVLKGAPSPVALMTNDNQNATPTGLDPTGSSRAAHAG